MLTNTYVQYCFFIYKQIEQELELILSKQNIYDRAFVSEWTQKWVPAIIKYCNTLKRNDIKALLLKDNNYNVIVVLFKL